MASELEVFILVAESGGFAGAARRLRLTPSEVAALNEWMCTATAPRAKRKSGRTKGPLTCSAYQPKYSAALVIGVHS